ncbi:tol-pal system protein YbgF [Catenovulum sp. SM1970]|uniref:tol-pal system protein YbgF n=1 Tax=Marinifaba aquimaris TaxID=2741323 RepID=UPI001573553D|nr:tol-pal system protein YbgF [Marinifaba aquimaris]NTS78131.1 tol-pal system protein YbgF [Marinifaba aquimaris]
MVKTHQSLALLGALALFANASFAYQKPRLEERVTKLERIVEARSQAQVNLSQQIDILQDEINQLRGVSEEHNFKLEKILQRQRQLYQELETRLSNVMQQTEQVAQQAASQATNSSVEFADNLSENEAYDRAVNLVLKDKRYEQAIPEFESFLSTYPASVYVPNAHYWLGQLLFNKGEYAKAETNFEKVVNDFPDSSKRCDSMFKLGLVAQAQNNNALAKTKYQAVLSECADSASARLAKNRLSGME